MNTCPIGNVRCNSHNTMVFTQSHLIRKNLDDVFPVKHWYLCPLHTFNAHRCTIEPIIFQNCLTSFIVNTPTLFSYLYPHYLNVFLSHSSIGIIWKRESSSFRSPFSADLGTRVAIWATKFSTCYCSCSGAVNSSEVFHGHLSVFLEPPTDFSGTKTRSSDVSKTAPITFRCGQNLIWIFIL